MRISDWSSDVCSSDLVVEGGEAAVAGPSVRWPEPGDDGPPVGAYQDVGGPQPPVDDAEVVQVCDCAGDRRHDSGQDRWLQRAGDLQRATGVLRPQHPALVVPLRGRKSVV